MTSRVTSREVVDNELRDETRDVPRHPDVDDEPREEKLSTRS
jgi:hypothetical protein